MRPGCGTSALYLVLFIVTFWRGSGVTGYVGLERQLGHIECTLPYIVFVLITVYSCKFKKKIMISVDYFFDYFFE